MKEQQITENKLYLSQEAFHELPFLLFSLRKEIEEELDYSWSAHAPLEFSYGPTFPIARLKTIFTESQILYKETIFEKGGE